MKQTAPFTCPASGEGHRKWPDTCCACSGRNRPIETLPLSTDPKALRAKRRMPARAS